MPTARCPAPRLARLTLVVGGTGYTAPLVTITDVYGTGSGATAHAVVTGGAITSLIRDNAGTGYTAPVVTITDPTGTGAVATAARDTTALSGGLEKFIELGWPG